MAHGKDLLKVAQRHLGEAYVLGVLAPKDNARWGGPWDCAEFVSWVVFQVTGLLRGCANNNADPASADAYTGFWRRDADKVLRRISVPEALHTCGAILLRVPAPGLIGHIVFSDGNGGTVEAHSSKLGVIAGTATGRRWDMGLLLPEVQYMRTDAVQVIPDERPVLRLTKPRMMGNTVKALQRALKHEGYNPGPLDGVFGPKTAAAVTAFQLASGLVPDGEAGPITLKALGP